MDISTPSSDAHSGDDRPRRKDLQDLRHLPRAPSLSYLQKQAQPKSPEERHRRPSRYPLIGAFTPGRIWDWLRQYVMFRIGPRHAFKTYDLQGAGDRGIYPLREEDGCIRLALAGDWATGTDEAHDVGQQIKEFKPHYTIHLGDVYYVGTEREVEENFLGHANPENDYKPCRWPAGKFGSFALSGNHEMYSRGFAYFDRMLPALRHVTDDGGAEEQKASYFCLQNDHWRIIGLDTAYNSVGLPVLEFVFPPSCALPDEVVEWLRKVVAPDADERGIVLLSHHQYFSSFDDWCPRAAEQLSKLISRPVLWLWGHEHRLAIYREYGIENGLRAFGRCIGHGGMPVELPTEVRHPECPLEFVDDRRYPNDEGLDIGFNGFARITLESNRLLAEYVDLRGETVFSETWECERGNLHRCEAMPLRPS